MLWDRMVITIGDLTAEDFQYYNHTQCRFQTCLPRDKRKDNAALRFGRKSWDDEMTMWHVKDIAPCSKKRLVMKPHISGLLQGQQNIYLALH